MASVLMRQTNIIWVMMVFGRYVVLHAVNNLLKRKQKKKNDLHVSERVSILDYSNFKFNFDSKC